MKTILTSVCSMALLCAVSLIAQDKGTAANQSMEVQQDTKTITPSGTTKVTTDTVYGRVENYQPGKSINVTIPGKVSSTKTFDLNNKNETVNVAANVKIGEWVSVVEKTDNNGHKTLTVRPSSGTHASRMKRGNQ